MQKFNNKHLKLIAILLLVFIVLTGCSKTVNVDKPIISYNEQNTSSNIDTDEIVELDTDEIVEDNIKPIDIIEDTIVEGQLEVHFIDVGQGDAMLIKQGSHSMVIDAGDNHYGQTVVYYLRQEGIKELDYVIGTHPHADHVGGLDDVINTFNVKSVIMPNKIHTTKTFEDVLEAINSKGLKITTPITGDKYSLGQAEFTILAPNSKDYNNLNNFSVSIIMQFGDNSFVMTGDAEKQAEQEMVNNGLEFDADVMKAGHHGSNTSNTDKFLDRVNPDYVVIQVGEGNKYNHPDKDILDKFNQRGIQVYRNDIHGSVVAISDGTNIKFTTRKGEIPPQTAKVPVVVTPNPEQIKEPTSIPITSNLVGTKTTKVLHKSDCRHVPKEENRQTFENKQDALDAGYRECKVCKP